MSQEVMDPQSQPPRAREAPVWLRRPGDRLARSLSAVGLERWARLAAALLSIVLLMLDGRFLIRAELVLGLATYVILTGLLRRGRYLRAADLAVAGVLGAVAGPDIGAFLPFLLVAVAGTATLGGALIGLLAGGTLALVTIVGALTLGDTTPVDDGGLLAVAFVLPLTGLVAASAGQLVTDPAVRDRLALQQANRLLQSLNELSRTLPGGLDTSTVTSAIVAELSSVPGVRAGVVLLRDRESVRADATTGLSPGVPSGVRPDELRQLLRRRRVLRADRDLPGPVAAACGHVPYWRALPLGAARPAEAALLAGFTEVEAARAARPQLRALALDGGLALDNARLFDRTQLRAADNARRRIAGELHDGVAQSLAHLKLELGLLARTDGVEPSELERLSRVAESALTELRGMIAGLRVPAASDLAILLARHLEVLRSDRGPRITLTVEDQVLLDPDRADEALRVAQEALSNALRHARATRIGVGLTTDAGTVTLRVADDGTGVAAPSEQAGGGVGLESMRERADRLGGRLELVTRARGGTEVVLTFPAAPILPNRSQR